MRALICLLVAAAPLLAGDIPDLPALPSPRWLKFGFEQRLRLEQFSAPGFTRPADNHLMNRMRFNLSLLPTRFLKFDFQVQDARLYWRNNQTNPNSYKNVFDLRIASLTLGQPGTGKIWLTAGRQELNFGDQRLVGAGNWGPLGRTFDAVKLDTRFTGVHLETFAASVVQTYPSMQDHHIAGSNLYGLYAHLDRLIPRAKFEPYLFWRVDHLAKLDTRTYGLRWTGKLPGAADYNLEFAGQGQTAAALHAQAGRLLTRYIYLSGEYNRASPQFDILYPTPHPKYGLTDQVGWKNAQQIRAGVDWKFRPNLAIGTYFYDSWLVDPRYGLFHSGGAVIVPAGNWRNTHIGQEFALDITYDINRNIQFRGGVGHLFAGAFVKEATGGSGYTFPYISLQYSFN